MPQDTPLHGAGAMEVSDRFNRAVIDAAST